jgi:hypothetical protein
MTPDVTHALAISGSILFGVVVLIIIISVITVRRGEATMAEIERKHGQSRH